jgi:hypothetical protein
VGRAWQFNAPDDEAAWGVVCGDVEAHAFYVSNETAARPWVLFPKHGDPSQRSDAEKNIKVL